MMITMNDKTCSPIEWPGARWDDDDDNDGDDDHNEWQDPVSLKTCSPFEFGDRGARWDAHLLTVGAGNKSEDISEEKDSHVRAVEH